MIGSLMYLTASRPDIMWAVCLCARFQMNPKESHEITVKRIFRYLKGTPKLGLWYPKDSNFDLIAYSDSDHAGCKVDRRSVSGGCQFLGNRLISWQSKKQTTVSTSTAQAEYTVAYSCCSQVLWIQNQLLDYGINIMKTPIFIDNETCLGIVKNPIHHSRTKHIEIRIHAIRDAYEKGYIQVVPVDTTQQRADIFTKAFDKTRFNQLVTWLEMVNFLDWK
ncbi:putative RNA-directed DNA polymerase [Helianthus annuus]|nr:putative RNA-directed DNA polymerase [Helianthus annuus]